ncbi:TPA: 3-dehydroquinate synthase [bacterium]|nr:3-dehydroquinate synthase [bacterium]
MNQIHVDLEKNSYIIHIDKGILPKFAEIAKNHLTLSKTAIVTNDVVGKLYGNILKESLNSAGIETIVIEIPDGEEYKSFAGAMMIYDALIENRINRQSVIIAMGGGVIGDLAGFVSATYMRGIPFIQIPTSLLAQVDSSVGGKTAINHPKAKNMIGAFHQPKFVFIDVDVLKTLPERELKAGLAEVIKHGIIMDAELFGYMEDNSAKILNLDSQCLEQIVARSCRDKANIVEQDEKESNIRAILNYGHTIGHGIEAVTDYNVYRHGEAVSIGMAVAGKLAVNLGILDEDIVERQNHLLKKYGLPTDFPDLDIDRVIEAIHLDKKSKSNGKSRFVLLKDIGEAIIYENVTDDQIRNAIMEMKG